MTLKGVEGRQTITVLVMEVHFYVVKMSELVNGGMLAFIVESL